MVFSAGGWTGGGIGGNPDIKLAETGGREGNDDCLRRGGRSGRYSLLRQRAGRNGSVDSSSKYKGCNNPNKSLYSQTFLVG